MNAHWIRLAIAACSLGAAMPASAADIRAQLTPELIFNHCRTHGVGSEIEGAFMLPGGRVTGTVLCTPSDLAAPQTSASKRHDNDDEERHQAIRDRHHDDEDDDDDRHD